MKTVLIGLVFLGLGGFFAYEGFAENQRMDALLANGARATATVKTMQVVEEEKSGRRGRKRIEKHYMLACDVQKADGTPGVLRAEVSAGFYGRMSEGKTAELVYDPDNRENYVFAEDTNTQGKPKTNMWLGVAFFLVGAAVAFFGVKSLKSSGEEVA